MIHAVVALLMLGWSVTVAEAGFSCEQVRGYVHQFGISDADLTRLSGCFRTVKQCRVKKCPPVAEPEPVATLEPTPVKTLRLLPVFAAEPTFATISLTDSPHPRKDTHMTGVEITIIALLVGLAGGAVGGFILASKIHTVAGAATSAVTRATTLPAGEVATLNAAIAGLGTQLAQHTAAVGAATNAIVAKVEAVAPAKPAA